MSNKIPADKIDGKFAGKDVVSLDQFDTKSLEKLFRRTEEIIKLSRNKKEGKILAGKIITLLFFEPSSRTFSSFSSAVKKMGAGTIEYQNPLQTSSAAKGETLEDSVKTFETYSDLIVMRHPEIGAAKKASKAVLIPVINAGDGGGEHPTQIFMDLFTIREKFGRLDNLIGVIAGDPLHSRVLRSLIAAAALYKNNTIYILSPKALRLEPSFLNKYRKQGIKLIEIENEKDIPKNAHFWYWNRVQRERFKNPAEYKRVIGKFILTPDLLKDRGNKNMIILNCLPRVEEIDIRVDDDPRAVYFTNQIKNGLYTRMALLSLVLGGRK